MTIDLLLLNKGYTASKLNDCGIKTRLAVNKDKSRNLELVYGLMSMTQDFQPDHSLPNTQTFKIFL